MRRLLSLGRRFKQDFNLKERYSAVLARYLEKGYAVRTLTEEVEDPTSFHWYLPHHAVMNPKKPDKVRVVFDCAAMFKGESLNKHLLVGPSIISNLVGILLHFRQGPIALSADIEDMFLQVKVPTEDQFALRFLWWADGNDANQIEEFRLTVHPFGAVSSPFCANYALKETANMFGHEFSSESSRAVLNSFYVDDLLLSVDTPAQASSIVKELCQLLSRTGFRLRKWSSNSREVLSHVASSERSGQLKDLSLYNLPTQRTFVLLWDIQSDVFRYQIEWPMDVMTRRKLLSRVASIYDPLGWISSFVLPLKQLLQRLCRNRLGWDEQLDVESNNILQELTDSLQIICSISVPRWYLSGFPLNYSRIELHIFCDASEIGYGAVAYFRFVLDQTPSRCVLLMSKSRIAPLEVVSIPRMELTAAVVAIQIHEIIKRELRMEYEVNFWTDSAVVLYYLRNGKTRLSTFVANRITKIRECCDITQWHHVASKDNPADLTSRGLGNEPKKLDIWFQGPHFLRSSGDITYESQCIGEVSPDVLELKHKAVIGALEHTLNFMERFSSWSRLLRAIAWLLRYKQYLLILAKGQSERSLKLGPLNIEDIRTSLREVVRLVQMDVFGREIELLEHDENARKLKRYTTLRKLNPMMIDGLLCVGGRLQWSDLPDAAKHPIILLAKHVVTDLIIKHYHELEGHVGCTRVLAVIRKRFWILQGRAAVRRVLGRCLRCRKESAQPCYQQLAPLPEVRTNNPGYAFAYVGVDYFGPFLVKRGRAEEKRYGCICTCLSIRAVHIE
ncbi:reverse transcriptase domain-containing protein [Streptococcus dysgalactiae]|uniref:reverse transcriptase domain-containing protein n=1 Tax=Streptococcus dysgalactiae TaxID=1334 RepID=UPI00194E5D76|nr:reverse transcriptase domain-containing protein [Streptococcus dysgalactiae]MBM6549319.1 hypothetical protein [Streptococcus dysgalactiae subsp. equisimilis]